jgi:dTDP-D-glucose 4,6-dehydratase
MLSKLINMTIKNAVVIGASGFIGQAMVKYLFDNCVNVIAVDITPCKRRICDERVLDLRVPGALDHYIDKETVVFHLAAHADVESSVTNPRKDFDLNFPNFVHIEHLLKDFRYPYPRGQGLIDARRSWGYHHMRSGAKCSVMGKILSEKITQWNRGQINQ